jgi:hypothetical protein
MLGYGGDELARTENLEVAVDLLVQPDRMIEFTEPAHRRDFATWTARGFDTDLMGHLVRFGLGSL